MGYGNSGSTLDTWHAIGVGRIPTFVMARPIRIEFENAVYHVTDRGNERRAIYRDDHDRYR